MANTVYPITEQALTRFWPSAPLAVIKGYVAAWPKVAAHYNFNTTQRCARFWTEITWEGGAGTELRENLSYSAARILQVFGEHHSAKIVTLSEAKSLEHQPYALGERVYGLGNPHMAGVLGNTQRGDGYNCRGTGPLNTTGREALTKTGKKIGIDIMSDPDKIGNDPNVSLWIGAQEYSDLGCIEISDTNDIVRERKRINGGTNGLSSLEDLLPQWTAYFETVQPISIEAGNITVTLPPGSPVATNSKVQFFPPLDEDEKKLNPAPPAITGNHPVDLVAKGTAILTPILISHSMPNAPWWAVLGISVFAICAVGLVWAGFRMKLK